MMLAKFKGGPYDGTELDHNDIRLYTKFMPVAGRQFVVMPANKNWDAIRRGEIEPENAFDESSPFYELIRTPIGMEAIYDHGCEQFGAAHQDESEGRVPAPVEPPFFGAYYQCFRGEWAFSIDGFSAVVDEKGRTWACREIGHEGWGPSNPSDTSRIWAAHRDCGTDERLREVTHHCDSLTDLAAELADEID